MRGEIALESIRSAEVGENRTSWVIRKPGVKGSASTKHIPDVSLPCFVRMRQHANERSVSKYPVMDKHGSRMQRGEATILKPWQWNFGQTK